MNSWNRKIGLITILILLVHAPGTVAEFDHSYKTYASFLSSYVASGRVSYKSIHDQTDKLENVIREFVSVNETDFESFNRSEQIAYFINAYNLYTIKAIVDRYPVGSIKDISGVWNRLRFQVAGRKLTLDNIEHDYLRKKYKEPRIHIALVCASVSCPELWNKPFTPDSLEQQLNDRAAAFANDTLRNSVDSVENKIHLSKILKWYGNDFIDQYLPENRWSALGDKKSATVNFLFRYWPEPIRQAVVERKFKVAYKKYDWNLNE